MLPEPDITTGAAIVVDDSPKVNAVRAIVTIRQYREYLIAMFPLSILRLRYVTTKSSKLLPSG
jgi:hypothetical protein